MRAFHVFVVSAALFTLAIAALPVLHGGWDAVAGGVMLLSAITSMLAFALVRSPIVAAVLIGTLSLACAG